MASVLDLGLEDAEILAPVTGDTIQTLEIAKLEKKVQKEENGGQEYLQATVIFPDVPTATDMRIFLGFIFPKGDGSREAIRARSDIKKFYQGFNLPLALEFEEDGDVSFAPDARGATAQAVVGRKKNKGTGEEENYIKSFGSTKPAEGAAPATGGSRRGKQTSSI